MSDTTKGQMLSGLLMIRGKNCPGGIVGREILDPFRNFDLRTLKVLLVFRQAVLCADSRDDEN